MNVDKYLPIGTTIANKYEVIDVLGEDDFEILYLVRDANRKGSFFVLKELFLETFSSRREDELVFTESEALGVFHKRKKQIIEEINAKKSNLNPDEIKIYGYEDENNTIYTLMEFSSDAPLEKYLQFAANSEETLPLLKELLGEEEKSFNGSGLIKVLLLVGIGSGVAFYGYQFFQKKSETLEHPALKERTKEEVVTPPKKEQTPPKEEKQIAKPVVNLPEVDVNEDNKSIVLTDENISKVDEENSTLKTQIVEEELVIDNNEINNSDENKTSPSSKIEESMRKEEDNVTEILLPHITPPTVAGSNEANNKIKNFLDAYIEASASSINESLKFYDKHVYRYFRFRNATHKTIAKSQKRYNKKWVKREFKILNFKVLKSYQKSNVNYFNIKTTTQWTVTSKNGRKKSGTSRGIMTIKEVADSFKITSIRTLK